MWKAMSEEKGDDPRVLPYNDNDGVTHNRHLDAFYGTDPSICMMEEDGVHRQEIPTEDEDMDSHSDDRDFSYEKTYYQPRMK
jgi:hypothetical protein